MKILKIIKQGREIKIWQNLPTANCLLPTYPAKMYSINLARTKQNIIYQAL